MANIARGTAHGIGRRDSQPEGVEEKLHSLCDIGAYVPERRADKTVLHGGGGSDISRPEQGGEAYTGLFEAEDCGHDIRCDEDYGIYTGHYGGAGHIVPDICG